jgi:PAS domain S-box-containing protein
MQGEDKSKEQLLSELAVLRQRVVELEKGKGPSSDVAELRHRALDRLRAKQTETDRPRTREDTENLLHELQVHQVELEMQNEELRNALEQLEESRTKYSDLYDFAPVGYVTLDENGLVLEANLTVARQLGIERGRLINYPLLAYIVPADGNVFRSHLGNVFKAKTHQACEARFMKGSGGEFHALLDTMFIENSVGQGRIRISVTDITERKRIEEEKEKLQSRLAQAQKLEAIGTLAGGIAHDFNNILGAILGFTEIALDDIPEGTSTRQDLAQVLKAAYRAKELVGQILSFSRQGEAQERRPIKVGLVVIEALRLIRATIPTTIELRQQITVDAGPVLADPTQIHQVVMNLCTNASHAMREKGGVLEVGLAEVEMDDAEAVNAPALLPGSYLRLSVRDTGHGMDHATIERIFDPYFTTKGVGDGTGLGLAVVHGIVVRHEGGITVSSEPGKGTTFQVRLPKLETARETESEVLPIRGGSERILFVDDEEPLASLVEKMLGQLGYRVTVQMDSMEAVDLFRAQPDAFDLIVTDYTMPHMTGIDLAAEILRIRPDIPIVLCTGFSENITAKKAQELGIKEFIMKPLTKRTLAAVIRKALTT